MRPLLKYCLATTLVSLQNILPGPPFVFGAFLVICALLTAVWIPELIFADKPRRPKAITPTLSFAGEDDEEEDVEVFRKEGLSRFEGSPLINFD